MSHRNLPGWAAALLCAEDAGARVWTKFLSEEGGLAVGPTPRADDLVDVGVDVRDDLAHFLLGDVPGAEHGRKVVDEKLEMVWFDAHSVVHMCERSTLVDGVSAQGNGEKFALHAADAFHGGVREEGGEFFILDDALVELIDKRAEGSVAADALEEGR